MRVSILTREYPPEIYGGAGVHVTHLVEQLSKLVDVDVQCFGAPRGDPRVRAYHPWPAIPSERAAEAALQSMSVDLLMASGCRGADVVHSHTWYANLGGHLGGLLHGIPHVMTAHSLEPLRPWKRDQLGGGYELSLFCERTAVHGASAIIAVSAGMRADILATYPSVDPDRVFVLHNGIDTDAWRPTADARALARLGVDPGRPAVVFVGRITRQKGVDHALAAAELIDRHAQVVLCAGAPDTPEIGAEMRQRAAAVAARRGGIVWIEEMLSRHELCAVLSAADVFLCPSVYEPFGLTNLEAMACETAVVASAVGGIPEIVVEDVTGHLVPVVPDGAEFAAALAGRVNALIADPERAAAMGRAGRLRAIEHFGWPAVAARTVALYERLAG
ncbi:MAG TPA: glycogen synthase [Acidimicrobiales bacterium]|nr:glycogen synthase [Acidimicrobiales bacterium]